MMLIRGINARGEIVGIAIEGIVGHAFLADLSHPNQVTEFEFPPGAFVTEAHGINAAGVVVGQSGLSRSSQGFIRYTDGSFSSFSVPGATATSANGINARGAIVGSYESDGTTHGFLLD
jgi:uncharacterized membrane protein